MDVAEHERCDREQSAARPTAALGGAARLLGDDGRRLRGVRRRVGGPAHLGRRFGDRRGARGRLALRRGRRRLRSRDRSGLHLGTCDPLGGKERVELGLVLEEPQARGVPEAELDPLASRYLLQRVGEVLEIAATDTDEVLATHDLDRPLGQLEGAALGGCDADVRTLALEQGDVHPLVGRQCLQVHALDLPDDPRAVARIAKEVVHPPLHDGHTLGVQNFEGHLPGIRDVL